MKILEYIRGNKTGYIDLGYAPNASTQIMLDFSPGTDSLNTWATYIGSESSDNGSDSVKLRYGLSNKFSANFGNTSNNGLEDILFGNRYNAYLSYGSVTLTTEHALTGTFAETATPMNLFLGDCNTKGSAANRKPFATYYKIEIYENSELVREYFPAEDNGVVGLYETQTTTFIAPATGAFEPGPQVGISVKPSTLTFNYTGGTKQAVLTSPFGSWSIVTPPEHFTFTVSSASSIEWIVTVTAGENEGTEMILEELNFSDSQGYTATLTLKQKPYSELISNIYFGDTQIDSIMIGSEQITGIYIGDEQIYG